MYFQKFKIFNAEESKIYLHKVNSLSSEFIFEIDDFFCTLGIAAYQNTQNIESYFSKTKKLNPTLWNNFESIYIKIKIVFEELFGCKVLYPAYKLSLPGFHIFEIGRKECFYGGSPHFDLSFKNIPFIQDNTSTNYPEHYSFTIPLQLPNSGSGLNIWELELSEFTSTMSEEDKLKICNEKNKSFIEYHLGEMVLFNGYNYHQIAAVNQIIRSDRRITMQGHLVKCNNNFLIYW
jgi:hypothetical protein